MQIIWAGSVYFEHYSNEMDRMLANILPEFLFSLEISWKCVFACACSHITSIKNNQANFCHSILFDDFVGSDHRWPWPFGWTTGFSHRQELVGGWQSCRRPMWRIGPFRSFLQVCSQSLFPLILNRMSVAVAQLYLNVWWNFRFLFLFSETKSSIWATCANVATLTQHAAHSTLELHAEFSSKLSVVRIKCFLIAFELSVCVCVIMMNHLHLPTLFDVIVILNNQLKLMFTPLHVHATANYFSFCII